MSINPISTISPSKLRTSEQGMVSMMTTMVLMIVVTLVVLGFAQISRRNQKEALDRQLSTQAFYAAETGINDARKLIQTAAANGTSIADKTSCAGSWITGILNPVIDAGANVRYSCLLVDVSPKILRYSDVGTTSIVVPMTANSGNFGSIKVDWQSKVANPTTAGCPTSLPVSPGNGQFSPASAWACAFGVLRIDLVPTTGALTPEGLREDTMTTFAVPFPSGTPGAVTSLPYPANPQNTNNPNNTRGIRCTASGCSLTITGLNLPSYYMRISSLYRNVSLQISGANAAGAQQEISNAQAVIDSTGRAQDVLRRIQVNVPLGATSENQMSDYALQSTDAICKRFSVLSGFFDPSVSGVTSTNRFCQP